MKEFFIKYLGLAGLVLYYPALVVAKVCVGIFLFCVMAVYVLLLTPIFGETDAPSWINNLYDWYAGN